jgi:hypothetical protein
MNNNLLSKQASRMILKSLAFSLGTLFFSLTAKSQNFEIGVFSGLLAPTDVFYSEEGKLGLTVGGSFTYVSPKKFHISSQVHKGRYKHRPTTGNQQVLATLPESIQVDVYFFYFGFGKSFRISEKYNLIINSGFGFYMENEKGTEDDIQIERGEKDYFRDATFPLQAEFRKEVSDNLLVGIKTGFYFTPFYSIGGFHLGPTISYRF